jgi:hypothetical protein
MVSDKPGTLTFMRRTLRRLAGVLIAVLLIGCAPKTYRALALSPEQQQRMATIAIMPPQIEVDEFSAGGSTTKIDEWCARAHENMDKALVSELSRKTRRRIVLREEGQFNPDQRRNFQETLALLQSIRASMLTMTRTGKPKDILDYTLGKEVQSLAPAADALLLVVGVNRIATGGRVALQTGAVLIGAAIGAATGVMPIMMPPGSSAHVEFLLVDAKTGAILWSNVVDTGQMGGHDLRDCDNADKAVKQGLEGFPL